MAEKQGEMETQWVLLQEVGSQTDAMLLTSLLQSADIPCRVVQETIGALMGLSASSLGRIRIEVPANQRELALQILAAPVAEPPAEPGDETTGESNANGSSDPPEC